MPENSGKQTRNRPILMKNTITTVILIAILCPSIGSCEEPIKIAVLEFGTVNWEMQTIKKQRLDKKYGFNIELRPVASPQAAKISLLSAASHVIVSDWIWVSRQRSTGSDFAFSPYSNTSGAVILKPDSNMESLLDLSGKRVGIAGGELDKNWLLLRGLAQQKFHVDLDREIEKVFGAPPLLNQQIQQDNVDAVITYWHYAARLEALGYKNFMTGQEILEHMGIGQNLPTLGYVFRTEWANDHKTAFNGFLQATIDAKDKLCESDDAWAAIVSLTRTDNPKVQKTLRTRYCAGRIKRWGEEEKRAAAKVYTLLRELTGDKLTGKSIQLQPGTFWNYTIGE